MHLCEVRGAPNPFPLRTVEVLGRLALQFCGTTYDTSTTQRRSSNISNWNIWQACDPWLVLLLSRCDKRYSHVFQMLNRVFAIHMFLSILKALHFDLLFWSARLVCEMMSEFSFTSLRVVFMCCCCEAFLLQILDNFCLTAASTRERATMLSTLTRQQTNQQAIGTVSATWIT